MRQGFILTTVAAALTLMSASGAVVVDRMAVVVGKHVVKESDIERDLRVTAFLNREPLALDAGARKKAAERLIDQEIIRQEVATGRYKRATDDDALALLKQIREERFGGAEARLRSALTQYGLSEAQLREQLLWQLTVLRFIEQHFRPGVLVDDEEVRVYYDQHQSELRKQYPQDNRFEVLAPKIRSSLEGERMDKALEAWIVQARTRNRIDYREEAFR
jgi:parvulin-like peptidyl-prolyl isomerase